MPAEELCKRGPPKNIVASGFYDNPNGIEARADIVSSSQALGSTSRPSASKSLFEPRTQAPPADPRSVDPIAKMCNVPLSPKNVMSESTVKPRVKSTNTSSTGFDAIGRSFVFQSSILIFRSSLIECPIFRQSFIDGSAWKENKA